MERPWCRFRREARAREDIDTATVGSLKALDPNWPIREADIRQLKGGVRYTPKSGHAEKGSGCPLSARRRHGLLD
jgi:hypothetical protein